MRISDWSSDVCSSDLAPDQLSDVETIVGIPSPMREQEAGEAGIGDKADMRAAVAEPEQGIGIADHRAARGKIVVEIIDDRREQQRAPLLLEEKVVGHLPEAPDLARCDGGNRAIGSEQWRA